MKSDIENVMWSDVSFRPALCESHITHNRFIIQLLVIWKIGVWYRVLFLLCLWALQRSHNVPVYAGPPFDNASVLWDTL